MLVLRECLLLLVLFFLRSECLICPVYNVLNNESSAVRPCYGNASSCTYVTSRSSIHRCLGIYTFDNASRTAETRIRVRQLALMDDFEEKYVNRSECVLDIDRIGQNLLCRCNSDNCTLNWHTAKDFNYETFQQRNPFDQRFIEQDDNSSWSLPLLIAFSILMLTLVVVLIVVFTAQWLRYRRRKEKDDRSFFTDLSSASTNTCNNEIEEFLSSSPSPQSLISQGKTSTIYRAWTTGRASLSHEKKLVAIKVYHGQQYKHLFENEIELLRIVDHSAIVKLISYGWHGPSPYVLLEYHPLGSLDQYLRSHKLPWSTCYSFLLTLLEAIDYLHYENLSPNDYFTSSRIRKPIMIHRDIKTSNIVVQSSSQPSLCLIDLGLGKVLPSILAPNDFIQVGTYRYMAPELLELAITHTSEALCKVDMYAVGLVMWEIVTQCLDYPCLVEYQLPYQEFISASEHNENRILETLHRVVVNERKRPVIHRTPNMNARISDVLTIVDDCWKHEPDSRINARPALSRLRRLEHPQNE